MLSLTRHRDAGERPERLARATTYLEGGGLRQHVLAVDVHQRPGPRLGLDDPVQMRLGHLERGHVAVAHELRDPVRRQLGQRPAARAGTPYDPSGATYAENVMARG